MPTTDVAGLPMYYEEQGQGEPVLLIMGLGAHSGWWAFQVAALAQHYRTIAFDNRGAGRTAAPPGPYSIAQMADDAAGLMDRLDVERAHVIGDSMGGMIAQELALRHPTRVKRLALVSTLARVKPKISDWWLGFGEWVRDRDPDPCQFLIWALPWLYTPNFLTQLPLVEAAVEQGAIDPYVIGKDAFHAQAAACRAHDTLDRLGAITAETLVLVGAEDILTPPSYSRELAAGIAGARLQILEKGGHGFLIEYAQAVNQALLSFLGSPVSVAS